MKNRNGQNSQVFNLYLANNRNMVRSCQSAGAFFMEGGMYDGHHQQARRPDCVTEVRMGNTGLTVFVYIK